MALNRKTFKKVAGDAPANLPSGYFNTVLYTGNGSTQKIGGYINRGAVFNGSSSYIDLGNNSSNNGSLISVSCWFRTSSTSAGLIWNNGGNDSSSTGLALKSLASGVLYFQANTSGTSVTDTGTTTINDGNWHHVVVNYDNGDFNVYLDGNSTAELTGTSSAFTTTANQNFIIGRLSRVLVDYFNGAIDQFRIFNRELTTTEVTTLYGETFASASKSVTDIFSDSSGVALYRLDGNANDTGPDGGYSIDGSIRSSSNGDYFDTNIDQLQTQTISFWAKIPTSTGGNRSLLDTRNSSGESGILLRTTSNNNELEFSDYATSSNNSTGTWSSTESDVYKHFLIILESTQARIYENNVLKATVSAASTNIQNGGDIYFGDNPLSSVIASDANIEYKQIRTYSRALSDTDRTALYNDNFTNLNVISTPESWFNFDNNNSGSVNDKTRSYTGNISGMTYTAPSNYDGTATNITYQDATNFTPDLVWIKKRSSSSNSDHMLFDSVRGADIVIIPNSTQAQYDGGGTGYLPSFDSNGFSVTGNAFVGQSGQTFAAWCFNAGGASSTDTSGDLNADISANQEAGFSIIKHNPQTSNNQTIPHGLSQAPELLITKSLNLSLYWGVFLPSILSTGYYMNLNTSNGSGNGGVSGQGYTPTVDDTFITTPTTAYSYYFGYTGSTSQIIYAFHSVDGIQKVGTYTGTGASGNLVETGFECAFILFKRTDSGDRWLMADNKRADALTNMDDFLDAQDTAQEATFGATNGINFLSNGFSINTTDGVLNANNGTYIYLAIAADPDTTTPTVANSFDVVTYTGTGAAQEIVTSFKPDFAWIKSRSHSTSHELHDSVRGEFSRISSDTTSAESTTANGFVSLTDNGFSLDGAGSGGEVNTSGREYVAWVFKAGDHDKNLPQINTEGSSGGSTFESIVSVNAEAGFSIVKWTGTLTSSGNISVGHGLSSPPELIISKRIDSSGDWRIRPFFLNNNPYDYLEFDTGSLAQLSSSDGTMSLPTSTTFDNNWNSALGGVGDVIGYCFHSVTGYQKVGSYTGTGVSGLDVSLSFSPRFLLVKGVGSTGWILIDSQRGSKELYANLSDAEDASATAFVLGTNKFTVNSTGTWHNSYDVDYIYLAIK